MRLENIGFYTLEDLRALNCGPLSPMWRCELIIISACNFRCPYCRPLRHDCRGVMPLEQALYVLNQWIGQGLRNVRFSGGEPTLHTELTRMVEHCKAAGVRRIAISSNGSAPRERYADLVAAGANDFSISLDACCASDAKRMSGGLCVLDNVTENIRWLASKVYTTVGVVMTNENYAGLNNTIQFADSLGCADVRIISAAPENFLLECVDQIPPEILDRNPILRYRAHNIRRGRGVRGIRPSDCGVCHLMNDDSVVAGDQHFPCIIYLREGGEPIGKVGPNMRKERVRWLLSHNTHLDPICSANCLDVCVDYNNRVHELRVHRSQDAKTPPSHDGQGA